MTDHTLTLGDDGSTEDSLAPAPVVPRRPYTVVTESGMFKNGEQIPQGGTVQLDDRTAVNALAAGDVEEVKS